VDRRIRALVELRSPPQRGIRYVSPAQRHGGDDHAILAARHALYSRARELNPARWSGDTRN